jgi:signal transduction histidine kinase
MNRDERRLLLYFALLVSALLALAGFLLRGWVARTLTAENKVHLAFLDLALRDRSRFLGETLSERREREDGWQRDLADLLTRNHADYNRDIFMQVFEPDGRLVAASANTPPKVALARHDGGDAPSWQSHDVTGADDRPLRLVTYPIHTGLGTAEGIRIHGYTQAGLLLPDTGRALARFTWVMIASLAGFGALFVVALRAAVLAAAQRLQRESQTLQAAQHRFIGDAAHELGTPLAVLRGEIDIALRRERTAEDYRAALASCREEIERLSRLSENLLALATADAGHAFIHRAPCDAADIARTVHHRFARLAQEKGVAFSLEVAGALPWTADALAIEQVLGNLVSNALRHTPAGESVTLTATAETDAIVFRVTDTGEGIPPAHLPRLFERFHRVDKARSRAAGGAGLGLAIVRTLVEAHGGRVEVTSELGKGTTFTCRFPRAAA